MPKRALITGGAGFIGSHLLDRLRSDGWSVTILDNFDDFYDSSIKQANISSHRQSPDFRIVVGDVRSLVSRIDVLNEKYDVIVHLAARAGVRPSIENPVLYQDVNVNGTQALLEFARQKGIPKIVFASSSSVYGVNPDVPWSEDNNRLAPISPYAATKIAGELLGHVYSKLYGISFIALRFFTVYGPRQRPDLAIHKFARLMLDHKPIPVFGEGNTRRDYTYVSNIIDGIVAAIHYERSPFEVINLGNNQTVSLLELIGHIEEALGIRARIEWLPEQPGDVPQTWANLEKARSLLGYSSHYPLEDGLKTFVDWLRVQTSEADHSLLKRPA
jgi:UDP-glucuronate 4-epimerase